MKRFMPAIAACCMICTCTQARRKPKQKPTTGQTIEVLADAMTQIDEMTDTVEDQQEELKKIGDSIETIEEDLNALLKKDDENSDEFDLDAFLQEMEELSKETEIITQEATHMIKEADDLEKKVDAVTGDDQ